MKGDKNRYPMKIYICSDNVKTKNELSKIVKDLLGKYGFEYRLIHISTDRKEYEKEIEDSRLGIYILNSEKKRDSEVIQIAKNLREQDPRGFIILIASDMTIMNEVFVEKIELVDFIEMTNEEDLKRRLAENLLNIKEKMDISEKTNNKIFVNDINGIKAIDMNHIKYVMKVGNNKYMIYTNTGEYIYKGKLSKYGNILERLLVE